MTVAITAITNTAVNVKRALEPLLVMWSHIWLIAHATPPWPEDNGILRIEKHEEPFPHNVCKCRKCLCAGS